jgi:2-hydroxy-3-oxopropionate reductase
MALNVALIGAGATGRAIGTRIAQTGQNLMAFDLDPAKVAQIVAHGTKAARSAAEATTSDDVIISLNATRIIDIAVFGKDGVATWAQPGTLIIDMSSIDPAAPKDLAAKAAAKGLRWVDSPLSGGAPKALPGELTLMAGGDARDVADAPEILGHVANDYMHMGPVGAGQTTKLINQVLCGLNFMAVAEATQLALDAGVDAAKIPQALKGGRADSAILREYRPRFATKDYRRTGRIDNMVKDLNGAQDLARRTNTTMPLTRHLCRNPPHADSGGSGGRGSGRTDGLLHRTRQRLVRMITSVAIFESCITDGKTAAFHHDLTTRLVPLWTQFPGHTDLRVMFGQDRDPGAPEFPLILAISYPSMAVMTTALTSDVRSRSRDVTGQIVAEHFAGRIHHRVTHATEHKA